MQICARVAFVCVCDLAIFLCAVDVTCAFALAMARRQRVTADAGTEKDKVNCSFFFKTGSCRHGEWSGDVRREAPPTRRAIGAGDVLFAKRRVAGRLAAAAGGSVAVAYGACRVGDSCSRAHNKPPLSQTAAVPQSLRAAAV